MTIQQKSKPSLEEVNQRLIELSLASRTALQQQDFSQAKGYINQVLAIAPKHVIALTDLAFVEIRLGEYESAYQHALRALQLSKPPISSAIYETLTEVCHELKRFEEVLYFGKLTMKVRKAEVGNREKLPIPKKQPPRLSKKKNENIISYSLFGSNPRYCEVAVENSKLAKHIYPEWTCRFYVDETVPSSIIDRLESNDAQVIHVCEEQKKISGLFWRFLVNDDPTVKCFIIRDADSLLSYKERAAVDQWLSSKKWFHIMRDANMHTELILAGMWGGFTGVFPSMQQLMTTYLSTEQKETRIIDQLFLRHSIWPTVAQSVLTHDSKCFDPQSLPFPDYELSDIEKIPYFHIGMIDACFSTHIFVDDHTATKVEWTLKDELNQSICSYIANVPTARKVAVQLPYQYTQKIKQGHWKIYTKTIESV